MNDRNSSNNYFDNMDTIFKQMALQKINKVSLFSDPTLQDEFKKPILLKKQENDKLKEMVINSVLISFGDDFKELVTVEDNLIKYQDAEYLVAAGVYPMVDEMGQDWLFVGMLMPAITESSIMSESLDSLANKLNTISGYGLWGNLKDGEENTFAFMSGFTIRRNNWTLVTDAYASYGMMQLHAYGSKMLNDESFSSKTLTKIMSDNIAYQNENHPSREELLRYGLSGFVNNLSDKLQNAILIESDSLGYKFNIPLKEGNVNKYAMIRLMHWDNPILGAGLYVGTELPGLIPKNQMLKLAAKLNLDYQDSDDVIHTTPKLSGAWYGKPINVSEDWFTVSYSSFIPYAEPSNFTLSEHIEGVVREIYTTWRNFNEQIIFNQITESRNN